MKTTDLFFDFPESLIATKKAMSSRCLWVDDKPQEISFEKIFELFQPGDLWVINNTKVAPRRLFTKDNLEVLFVKTLVNDQWEVLFPARKLNIGDVVPLPGEKSFKLLQKGLPQIVEAIGLDEAYFEQHGELALPPYIQKARGERHNSRNDKLSYQTAWASVLGSTAVPTASLHFSHADLKKLDSKGVEIKELTLHVGLGTFLPIKAEHLEDHKMHKEHCELSKDLIEAIKATQSRGRKVWAMGTTVARALESWAYGLLQETPEGHFLGETDLFIKPGFEFKTVDVLMTNFHRPGSTLLALVCAFSGIEKVMTAYDYAIKNEFKLFSYGDLSLWTKQ